MKRSWQEFRLLIAESLIGLAIHIMPGDREETLIWAQSINGALLRIAAMNSKWLEQRRAQRKAQS